MARTLPKQLRLKLVKQLPLSPIHLTLPSTHTLSLITIQDLKESRRIDAGGFGEILLLDHPVIGQVALKRLHLSRCQADAEDQRRVSATLTRHFTVGSNF